MHITDFISNYKNHPVLFIGTGISLRYYQNSYTWDGLLSKISNDLKGTTEYYLDLKSGCQSDGRYKYEKIASLLEEEFTKELKNDRNGKFKEINDIFYENMDKEINLSRFKIYISKLFSELTYNTEKANEISELKKVRKNIGSVITTNYDCLIEDVFEFNPLIGNNILLSEPYGSVYKIHGCVSDPEKIIINESDYKLFVEKYELIRAQLLSLFIHNPIIFLGYNIGDENIKMILKTIFTYVDPNTDLGVKIKSNFLLVEYEKDSLNLEVVEHDILLEGSSTIQINKIKTDNFIGLYQALSDIHLPISAIDVRRVQSIVKDLYSSGDIKVSLADNLDSLKNEDKILVIGSSKTISYVYQSPKEMIANYFKIIDDSNAQIAALIDKFSIPNSQYFPIYGFIKINPDIDSKHIIRNHQSANLKKTIDDMLPVCKNTHTSIEAIMEDDEIASSFKNKAILWSVMNKNISLDMTEEYLRNQRNKSETDYRKIICAFDYIKYNV